MKPIPILLGAVLLGGCSESPRTVTTTHTGDLGQFILQTVQQHGGQTKNTNGLPQIPSQWHRDVTTGAEYLDGREQVVIRVAGDHFQEVTDYLAQAYGPPSEPAQTVTNGLVHGWYWGTNLGVGLQFYRDRKETGLILVGELKK